MRGPKHAGHWVVVWAGATVASVLFVGAQTLPSTPGDPLPGLSPAELAMFREGLDFFLDEFVDKDGLGPAFNGASCSACHNVPAVGGTGVILETRAAYRDASGGVSGLNPR